MLNSLTPASVLKDFPPLAEMSHYLDSAASTLTPLPVIAAMDDYYRSYRANIHRGLYASALRASKEYEDARSRVAAFIGADDPSEIVFTSGATAAANMIVAMLVGSNLLHKGDTLVTSQMEHHAALIPLQQCAKKNELHLEHIPLKGTRLDMDIAEKMIMSPAAVVSVMLASNVLGTINDVKALSAIAKKSGALTIVDATAAVGHIPVNVKDLGADALYFSAHKMLGPTGVGVLWIRATLGVKMEPAVWGGGMISRVTDDSAEWTDIPGRFEPGTPNIAGAIGLHAAITYLENIGLPEIHAHVARLVDDASNRLSTLPGVHVISERDGHANVGDVAFTVEGVHPHDLAQILADNGVAVRAGHHCAMPLHSALGLQATTRASYYLYNSTDDTDALIDGVKKAQKIFTAH